MAVEPVDAVAGGYPYILVVVFVEGAKACVGESLVGTETDGSLGTEVCLEGKDEGD